MKMAIGCNHSGLQLKDEGSTVPNGLPDKRIDDHEDRYGRIQESGLKKMKIGIINFDTVPAAVNQLMHIMLPELIGKHHVTGIEIDHHKGNVSYKAFTEEAVKDSFNLSKRLLMSSPILEPDMYRVLLPFDAVIAIGTKKSLHVIEKLASLAERTRFLLVPVSIYNDIENSEISLGYDSAINSIVEGILKIRDTIDSLKYPKPRLFGIQIPGEAPDQMVKDIALAVDGFDIPQSFGKPEAKQLERNLQACFMSGKNYSFVIYNEPATANLLANMDFQSLNIDWKINKIDEAICIGQRPTARDRIIAAKLAKQVIRWIPSTQKEASQLVFRSGRVKLLEFNTI